MNYAGTPFGLQAFGGLGERYGDPGSPGGAAPGTISYPSDYGSDYDCRVYVTSPAGTMEIERGYLLNIRLNESAPATWVLSIDDEDGSYSPERRLGPDGSPNPWYGVLTQQAFDFADGISYSRLMTAEITHGGESLTFEGPPTARGDTSRWPDGRIRTTWSGTDKSHVLFRPMQSMSTIKATPTKYSADAMAGVCANYGLGFSAGNMPTNIPVPKQIRIKEQPIKWIQDLASVPVAEWQMDGNTLRMYVPDSGGAITLDGTFDLSNDWIEEVQDDYSEVGFAFDRVIAVRALEVAQIIQGTPVPVEKYDQYDAPFPQPVANVRWDVVNAFNGVFSDFTGYLHGSAVATARRRIVGGATLGGVAVDVIDYSSTGNWSLVDDVKFTWGPPLTYTSAQANTVKQASAVAGLIRFRGSDPALSSFGPQTMWEASDPPQPTGGGPGITIVTRGDGQYEVRLHGLVVGTTSTLIDAQNLAGTLLGAHPKVLEPNEFIPNDSWLQINARRTRRKLMRDALRARLKMPLRLGVRVGSWWRYIHPRKGIDRIVYVANVEHLVSRNWQSRTTTVSIATYPTY